MTKEKAGNSQASTQLKFEFSKGTVMATDAASILSIALQVLSTKILVLVTLGINAGLFFWSMWYHSWISLAVAASFSVLVFLPVLYRSERHGPKDHETS